MLKIQPRKRTVKKDPPLETKGGAPAKPFPASAYCCERGGAPAGAVEAAGLFAAAGAFAGAGAGALAGAAAPPELAPPNAPDAVSFGVERYPFTPFLATSI